MMVIRGCAGGEAGAIVGRRCTEVTVWARRWVILDGACGVWPGDVSEVEPVIVGCGGDPEGRTREFE